MAKIRKLNPLSKILLILNIIVSILLLISYLATFANPRDYLFIAIIGFGYQVLFVINVAFVVFWLFNIRIYSLLSLISILCGSMIIAENFGFNFSTVNKADTHTGLRMMAYNVHEFNGIEKLNGTSILDSVSNVISLNHPDIVSFEEFYFTRKDSANCVDLLKKAMGAKYFYFKSFNKANSWGGIGNAIFSKYQIIDTGSVNSYGFLKVKALYADIKYHSRILRVYGIHLAAVEIEEDEKKKYLRGRINLPSVNFIEGKLSTAFLNRCHQVEKIKSHMNHCPYPYIVAGDFNDTPISFAVNEIGDGLKNCFVEKGSGLGTTYFSAFPKLHIDYIMASPEFDVLTYQTIEKKLSDHKPIISDLKLN